MADTQVSVGASIVYAWSLWRASWRVIWGVLALNALAMTVQFAGAFAGDPALRTVGAVGQLAAQIMTYGAVYRIALADRHPGDPGFAPGPSGLQWRWMETRMLGASLLLGIFMTVVTILALIVVGAVAMGILINQGMTEPPKTLEAFWAALGPSGQPVVAAIGLLALVPLAFLYLRLFLVNAATADSGKVRVLDTWPLTRGNFLKIFSSWLMLQIPFFFLQTLVIAGAGSGAEGPIGAPAAFSAALVLGIALGGLYAPMMTAIQAYYYRNLAGPPGPGAQTPKP